MLAPTCLLNETDRFVFVLEQSDAPSLAYYSDKMEMDLRDKLLPLLHGKEVMKPKPAKDYQPSPIITQIVQRIKQLNKAGVAWHHHVLFPSCLFNKHAPKWALILEDPETSKILESLTDEEPVSDLKQVEPLFGN